MGRHRLSIEEEGRALVERLGGRWTSGGGMCRCPAHDDVTPSLSVRPGRSRLLLHCFAGCDTASVLRTLQAGRLLDPAVPAPADRASERGEDCRSAAAARIWLESRSIAGTPAAAYLASRGLAVDSPELRFHPRTPNGARPLTRHRPALIAAVRDDCGLLAVHRTFLDCVGHDRARERCGLGRFGSGAVRLGGTAARLGLAEGIETALSATALFGVPCWASLGTERFARISLPAEVRQLVLFLDRDAGGRRAEALARRAFADIAQIEAHYPPQPGEDWNDVLRASSRCSGRPMSQAALRRELAKP